MAFADVYAKKAVPFYPMPNTGTILDISAGHWVKGHKGQNVLNGGYALFWVIAALPNMFKSALAAACAAAVLRAFTKAQMHVHDTETTMVHERVERLTRLAMHIKLANMKVPENLMSEGRMFFTSSVDYDGTKITNLLKTFAKGREKDEKMVDLEIINPSTGKPYQYWTPMIEFWDSLSGLKAESATQMIEEGDVGTKDLNMLAMRVNSGKSQIVEQLPDLTAKYGIYFCGTAHVGQAYQLDPHKPNVKVLKHLKGDIKLKRVPENLSFHTGNCYVITSMEVMQDKEKKPQYPWERGDADDQAVDLIRLKLVNQRGKFGISGVPLPMVVSQKDGLIPEMSNFDYLKEDCGRFGIVGDNTNYALALVPDQKVNRNTIRQTFRGNYAMVNAARILVEMYWMFTYWTDFDFDLVCEPKQLYEDIKKLGYDWDLLLNTRFWSMPIEDGKDIPFLSTMDLLLMRVGKYHPYWYPKTRKQMELPEATPQGSETKK